MAPCRFLAFLVVVICVVSSGSADEKSACGKVKSSAKRSIISNGNVNVDVSALQKGLKRSVSEKDEDCSDSKKDKVEIKESAASAIPGHTEEVIENEKKSNVKGAHDYLVLPNKDSEEDHTPSRKDKLEKPARRHSPLWSLSKLIAQVDSKGSKKANISLATDAPVEKAATKTVVEGTENGVTKTNLATDPQKAIKATLSKAIEKVEKVIATKSAKLVSPVKADVKSKEPEKKQSNSTSAVGKPKAAGNMTSPNGKKTEKAAVKAIQDPYAEIAMGPDRPKVPELKSDAGDDGPIMKMNNGEMKPVPGAQAGKSAAPLGGQHDVGGLLDRLTDKLNSGGGGVAMDSPLTGTNDVKYVQSPMDEESTSKQAQAFAMDKLKDQADLSEVKSMTEQEGLLAGNGGANADPDAAAAADAAASAAAATPTNSESSPESDAQLLEKAASASSSSTDTAALEKALASASASSASQDASTLAAAGSDSGELSSDDGIAKSLSKAGQLSTEAVMNMLKGAKVPAADFSNAEVSPGPDPYEEGESQNAANSDIGSLFSSKSSTSNADSSSDLDTGSDTGSETGSELNEGSLSSLASAGLGSLAGGSDELSTRSSSTAESDSDDDYERNTIPAAIDMNSDSFRNRYNTEVFKKHVIMRPKRDTYISPFNTKESFDTAI